MSAFHPVKISPVSSNGSLHSQFLVLKPIISNKRTKKSVHRGKYGGRSGRGSGINRWPACGQGVPGFSGEVLMTGCVTYGHPAGPTVTRRRHSQACTKGPELAQGAQSDSDMSQSPDLVFSLGTFVKSKLSNTCSKFI